VFVFRNVPLREFTMQAALLAAFVAMQFALGLATLAVHVPKDVLGQLTPVQIVLPTAHLALGALILATSLTVTIKSIRDLVLTKELAVMPLATGAVS